MIKRRRLVALVSAIALLVIGFVTVVTGLFMTRTSYGQEELRKLIQSQLASAILGRVYVGPVSGGFLTGIAVDSFAIRDADNDSLLISTGRITASYDPRDLIDKRLLLRDVQVEHPVVFIRQHASGRWNFKEIFRGYDKKNNGPKAPGRNFGDFVVIDSARVHDASFVLQMPWTPDDTLHGAKLDSAVRYTLARRDKEIRRVIDEGKAGFAHSWRWTKLSAVVSRIRLADPDSDKFGKLFVFDSMHAVESDPPFDFHNIRGTLRNLGDSIWIDVAHFDLPASTGAGNGKIVWGSDLPVRYDITVRGDSIALNDVAWVYPTLPTTGGGKATLHIGNEPQNLHIIDYKLTNMDVKSTGSHLVGDMTFAVGGPVLGVKDVKMSAQPFDFDLLRALNGKPFPVDWRGQLYGTVRARGGPLTRFFVDESDVVFHDAHVAGATSRVGGKGELDILQPALTSFRHFDVNAASVDLRSIEFLYPNFPRLGGTISGTATLDSSWLDIRFADADITHRDGPGEPSHLTGSGRVTWGPQYMTYDIDAQAQPVSLGMLARSYPKLPLTGVMSGPVKARGTIADLALTTNLQGPAGAVSFDGRIDIDPPSYGIHGAGQLTGLAVHALLDPTRINGTVRPATVTGRFDVSLSGDSLADLEGSAAFDVARADVDGLRIFPSNARLRFVNKRLFVDTLRLETTAATILAHGALGLPHGASDSLHYQLIVDSLGGFRRYLASRSPEDSALADSLGGQVTVNGVALGRLDSLDVAGAVVGNGLLVGNNRGRIVGGRFAIRNVLSDPTGTASVRFDTLTIDGVLLDSLGADVTLAGRSRAAFTIGVRSDNGPTARIVGGALATGGALGAREASTRVALDSLGLTIGESKWRLASASHVSHDTLGLAIDSLVLVNGAGGRIGVRGAAPRLAPVGLDIAADSIGLADLGVLLQLPAPVGGFASMHGRVTGTRAQPDIRFDALMSKVAYGGMRVERATATGEYRERSLDMSIDLFRDKKPALHATMGVPMALSLFSAERLDAPIHGVVRADSADLAVIEMLSPSLQKGSGSLTANLEYSISPTHKSINGLVAVRNGQVTAQNLGITLRTINGSVRFDGRSDSVRIDLSAASGNLPGARVALRGSVSYAKWNDPKFNLALFAHNFHAIERRTLASLDVSTAGDSLRLNGSLSAAAVTGTIRVDRGNVYLPERDLLRKQVIDLSGAGIFDIIDSTDFRTRQILPDASSRLVENLRLDDVHVVLGDEVWLRSREANIKLGGSLNVRSAEKQANLNTASRGGRSLSSNPDYGLALSGKLTADRGTYTLDLSPAPVQREFEVEKGSLEFYGTSDYNAQVDITATHAVKRAGQTDLIIQVHLGGYLFPNPTIELSSRNESYLSPSDLVSYLVTGQPAYALNSNDFNVVQQVSNVVGPTLSSAVESAARQAGFNWFEFSLQTGAAPTALTGNTTSQSTFKDFVFTSRLGAEKQISNNLFFSISAGLCSLNRDYSQGNSAIGGFVEALGGKLEYRFNPRVSLTAGTDPPTSWQYCRSNFSLGSVVSTPRQWGLSVLRTWHF
ncbi:MAG TPA: translocation/assembly module TamB domain-containing protein [Gemmatimonadaceae bacterium]|jgi:translocation and assembly module TamB